MELSPDQEIFWQYSFIKINLTLVSTWAIMIFMTVSSYFMTRNILDKINSSRLQSFLEIIVTFINSQIKEVGLNEASKYIGFLGTIFLFVSVSCVFTVLPGYNPPTESLSTTTALAFCVFISVPYFGIKDQGLKHYLKTYAEPTIIMLPFNIISELSRTLALAVRLFGNMMSGAMIIAILLTVTPFIFPIFMTLLGLLSGMVQAYIFTILATVYIAAGIRVRNSSDQNNNIN